MGSPEGITLKLARRIALAAQGFGVARPASINAGHLRRTIDRLSLHQIDRAYGHNHAILDNCHVRVAFAPNDERTAKRLSDALGTATELRAQTNARR